VHRPKDGSDVTGFGSSDNCKRTLDLLKPGDLRLGQVVIKTVASQACSEQRKWRWWKLFWNRGMNKYSKDGEYGSSRTWNR